MQLHGYWKNLQEIAHLNYISDFTVYSVKKDTSIFDPCYSLDRKTIGHSL
jgi:hypothetical protein